MEIMKRPLRIVLALLLLVAALFGLAVALSDIVITYYVPGPDVPGKGMVAVEQEYIHTPAIISSIVAGVVVLATAFWTYLSYRLPRPRSQWFLALGLVVVELLVVFAVNLSDTPVF